MIVHTIFLFNTFESSILKMAEYENIIGGIKVLIFPNPFA